MTTDDRQSHSLRRLRDCIESNLSKVAVYCGRLTAASSELDNFRRYQRDTLNTLPMAACAVDNHNTSHEVMLWNQTMTELTGISASDAIGRPLPAIAAPWNKILGDFLQRPEQHLNRHVVDVVGAAHYFSLHKVSIETGANSQVILLEDQTETRLLEEQLCHSERLALLGQLAASVAHEIGNPIMGIEILARELGSCTTDPKIRDHARQIREQADRVSRIVQSLVSYARAGSSLQRLDHLPNPEPVQIRTIIQEAITLLELSHKNCNIVFRNSCAADLFVSGDGQKLRQVFTNLLKNAADASQSDDHTKTSVVCARTLANRHTVTVHVEDQGHGIPGPVQEKMFDPFFTTKAAGTGLGLALTWNIIEEHAGTINVVSPLNPTTHRGTRFIISLPRCEMPATVSDTTPPWLTQEETA